MPNLQRQPDRMPHQLEVERVETRIRAELIDEVMDRYLDWREQCVALRKAYERWSNGTVSDQRWAFEAYRATLDLEEHSSDVYADWLNRFERELRWRLQRLVPRPVNRKERV
jgi:hypothetical protein